MKSTRSVVAILAFALISIAASAQTPVLRTAMEIPPDRTIWTKAENGWNACVSFRDQGHYVKVKYWEQPGGEKADYIDSYAPTRAYAWYAANDVLYVKWIGSPSTDLEEWGQFPMNRYGTSEDKAFVIEINNPDIEVTVVGLSGVFGSSRWALLPVNGSFSGTFTMTGGADVDFGLYFRPIGLSRQP